MVGCAAGTIRNLWAAIEDRHRVFGYTPPLALRGGDFSRFSKAVASVKGMPSMLIFPIGVHHIQRMLELVGLTVTQRRDMLMCVLGTVMCLRVNEVDQLQICDVIWNLDDGFHAKYRNTFACRLYKRKQDTARKGLYPRAVAAVADRLRAYTFQLGIAVSAHCSKGRLPGAQCRACMPLFPRVVKGEVTSSSRPVSRQQVTNAVFSSAHDRGGHSALQRKVHALRRH
jgi:hypothetical protein